LKGFNDISLKLSIEKDEFIITPMDFPGVHVRSKDEILHDGMAKRTDGELCFGRNIPCEAGGEVLVIPRDSC